MRVGISLPVRELTDDLGAIRAFARAAEELGLTHLRVPDQVLRANRGHLHEPLMLLAYVAAVTERIELVPSVIVAPARQTVLLAKQVAELAVLSGGRIRLGVGVGRDEVEFNALGEDYHTRGARLEEQIELLRRLWSEPSVSFEGEWDSVDGAGLDPLPREQIPVWIGPSARPGARIRQRIGRQADGWFVLCSPADYHLVRNDVDAAARAAQRDPAAIGAEAAVELVGPHAADWPDRMREWSDAGVSHLCLRTLGINLSPDQHIAKMREAAAALG